MAELLVLVVVAGVVLLYAVERARKLRARARQMSAMNERLDVAAAKVDEQQERRQARVRASAELTSVLPAIKRPPLTLPGVPGPGAGPAEEPAAPEPETGPAATAADDTPAAADQTPAVADAGDTLDRAGAAESPSAPPPDAAASPVAGDGSVAGDRPGTAGEAPPGPVRTPESTLTTGQVVPDATPAAKPQTTPDGTLIMPPVPGQGPAPAGETAHSPAPSRARPRASRPRASQPRAPQPRASQPHAGQQCTSQEQANRD